MMEELVDIGPECFTNGEVISYKGENYLKACDKFVADHADGSRTFCVRRKGHPGGVHEDYDGVLKFVTDLEEPDDEVYNAETPIVGKAFEDTAESPANFVKRHIAWERAKTLVDEIVNVLGLEDYRTGSAFGSTSTITKVDQYLSHIESVADWLLGED